MSAINNLKGHLVKDGKVVYSEQLEPGLHFMVILMYEPFYEGKNTANHRNSSQLICEAVMSTGVKQAWGNGVISIEEAATMQQADEKGKFPPLREELRTKDGFRVWQQDYQYSEKSRKVAWLVEVPKNELLRLCK